MALNQYSLNRLATLQPTVQPIFKAFLDACQAAGIPCEIVQGTRTHAEQADIYNDGRTEPGRVVTNAKPGDSYHQYGLAVDVVPVAYKNMKDWNPEGPYWAKIGAIGKGLGLTWGGSWPKPDKPHFQLTAAPLAELKAYWEKFKQVMPIEITPTVAGGAIILLIGLVIVMFYEPLKEKLGL